MVRKFIAMLAVATMFLAASATVSAAQEAYWGDWEYGTYDNGQRYLILGDGNGWALELGGTERYCVYSGAGYNTMERILRQNGTNGEQIYWWIDQTCRDGYTRVCVQNYRGDYACSTYADYGWFRW